MQYQYNYGLLGDLLEASGGLKVTCSEKTRWGQLDGNINELMCLSSISRLIESTLNGRNLSLVDPEMVRDITNIIASGSHAIQPGGWFKSVSSSSGNVLFLENRGTRTCIMIGPEGVFKCEKKREDKVISYSYPLAMRNNIFRGKKEAFPSPFPLEMRNTLFSYLHHRCFIDLKRINTNAFMIKDEEHDIFTQICEKYDLVLEDYIPHEFML